MDGEKNGKPYEQMHETWGVSNPPPIFASTPLDGGDVKHPKFSASSKNHQ